VAILHQRLALIRNAAVRHRSNQNPRKSDRNWPLLADRIRRIRLGAEAADCRLEALSETAKAGAFGGGGRSRDGVASFLWFELALIDGSLRREVLLRTAGNPWSAGVTTRATHLAGVRPTFELGRFPPRARLANSCLRL
jgi:hypothetical protein